jgi:hypothetical protein
MNLHLNITPNSQLDPSLLKEIVSALQEIHFGSIEIVIHDSRVVQIERKEKIRFDAESSRKRR